MFQVPVSSSPPSTPQSQSRRDDNPSTTPAGPPPTDLTAPSFTPVGAPPVSILGSSLLKAGYKPSITPSASRVGARAYPNGLLKSSPPTHNERLPHIRSDDDDNKHVGDASSDLEPMVEDRAHAVYGDDLVASTIAPIGATQVPSSSPFVAMADYSSPRGIKRSRLGQQVERSPLSVRKSNKVVAEGNPTIRAIAKAIGAEAEPAELVESDALILGTESILMGMRHNLKKTAVHDGAETTTAAAAQLLNLWKTEKAAMREIEENSDEQNEDISAYEAVDVAGLLVQLHHPAAGACGRSADAESGVQFAKAKAIPKLLLDWLTANRDTNASLALEVRSYQPSSTAHPNFWDVIFELALRGHVDDVVAMLRAADFSHALTAEEDGYDTPGYTGAVLQNVRKVVKLAVDAIATCPSITTGNWDVRGAEWDSFRQRLEQASSSLRNSSESNEDVDADGNGTFHAENFGLSKLQGSHIGSGAGIRKTGNKAPWSICECLKQLYSLLCGDTDVVIGSASDWVEAVVGLAVWWDGHQEDFKKSALGSTRRFGDRSGRVRPVDVTPSSAYRHRLAFALTRVLDDKHTDLAINPDSQEEVALACALDDNTEGLIGILRAWSMTVTASLVELGQAAGWLESATPSSDNLTASFSKTDLMLLDRAEEETERVTREDFLCEYARALSRKGTLSYRRKKVQKEGWEVGVQILSRVESKELSKLTIDLILGNLERNSAAKVDKIVNVCNEFGFQKEACNIAESYADSLAEHTSQYGNILLYYARAHNAQKTRAVLNSLISLSLGNSSAYPSDKELDEQLRSFLDTKTDALHDLAILDQEAAQTLAAHFSGYATVRRFYDTRDLHHRQSRSYGSVISKSARLTECGLMLVSLISSASVGIRGGLIDPEAESIVPTDNLIALFGELLPLFGKTRHSFTANQLYDILSAIEDIQTAPHQVYQKSEEFAKSAAKKASSTDGLAATTSTKNYSSASGLFESSQFSALDHPHIGSQVPAQSQSQPSIGSSGVLIKSEIKRGWDWRIGWRGAPSGADIIRILRLKIAIELAKVWVDCKD